MRRLLAVTLAAGLAIAPAAHASPAVSFATRAGAAYATALACGPDGLAYARDTYPAILRGIDRLAPRLPDLDRAAHAFRVGRRAAMPRPSDPACAAATATLYRIGRDNRRTDPETEANQP